MVKQMKEKKLKARLQVLIIESKKTMLGELNVVTLIV